MRIDERAVGAAIVLDVTGNVTSGEGDECLKTPVHSLVKRRHKSIFLNVADVLSVDSIGLVEIVRSYATVRRSCGTLKLLNLTARLKELLSIAKLEYLEGSEGEEEA